MQSVLRSIRRLLPSYKVNQEGVPSVWAYIIAILIGGFSTLLYGVVFGPALSRRPVAIRVGPVITEALGSAPPLTSHRRRLPRCCETSRLPSGWPFRTPCGVPPAT